MTDLSKAQSAAIYTATWQPQMRARRFLLVIVSALSTITLTSLSFAAPTPSPKGHPAGAASTHHAAVHAASTHPNAPTHKAKHPQAKREIQRKTPVNARLATKSKAEPKARAQRTPRKPTRLASKKTKHVA
jgi:hypothetical protein